MRGHSQIKMASETTHKPSPLLKFERQDSGGTDTTPLPMDATGPKKDAVYKGPLLTSSATGTPRGGSPLTVVGSSNSRTSSPAPPFTDDVKRELDVTFRIIKLCSFLYLCFILHMRTSVSLSHKYYTLRVPEGGRITCRLKFFKFWVPYI